MLPLIDAKRWLLANSTICCLRTVDDPAPASRHQCLGPYAD
jgi:hypothetical protein